MTTDLAMPMMMDARLILRFKNRWRLPCKRERLTPVLVVVRLKRSDTQKRIFKNLALMKRILLKTMVAIFTSSKGEQVRIIDAFPPEDMKAIGAVKVDEKGFYPTEMYVDGDTLTVIGQSTVLCLR